MRRRWVIPLIAILSGSLAHAGEERPQNLAEAKAKDQLQTLAEAATLPIITVNSPTDVVQLAIRDNDLVVTTKISPTDQAVVRAPGLGGLTRVNVMRQQVDPIRPPVESFSFENVDYSVPGVVAVHTSINQGPGKITIAQEQDRLKDEMYSVQLIQTTGELGEGDHRIMLYVQISGSPEVNKKIPAESIVDLRRRHPAETAMYVEPIFRVLRQPGFLSKVDPRLAWQVFADAFVPSPQLQSDLKTVLARLDADDFPAREAASRDLEKLGQPAALALMKTDRKTLSDEQRGRIDAFVAKFRTVEPDQAERYRRDPDFLLDCLYADELAIRTRALAQLQKVVGKPIDFDVSADAEHRLAAIEKLRAALGAPPTSQQAFKE
jgi:hypothetical protein